MDVPVPPVLNAEIINWHFSLIPITRITESLPKTSCDVTGCKINRITRPAEGQRWTDSMHLQLIDWQAFWVAWWCVTTRWPLCGLSPSWVVTAHLERGLTASWRGFYQSTLEPHQRFSHMSHTWCLCISDCMCVPICVCASLFLFSAIDSGSLGSSPAACTTTELLSLSLRLPAFITVWKVTTQSRGLLSSAPLSSWMQVWVQQVWQIWLRALLIWQNHSWTNY